MTKKKRVTGGVTTRVTEGGISTTKIKIFQLLTQESHTPQQIARKLGMARNTVYRHIRKLTQEGFIDKNFNALKGVTKGGVGCNPPPPQMWELHACAWRVEILDGAQNPRYKKHVSQTVHVLGCTVELYKDVIVIYYDGAFRSDDPDGCIIKSWDFAWKIISVLERDYGLMLRKSRHANVKRFRGHFPRVNDEGAQMVGDGEKIRVYAEDGKVRFQVDWSKGNVPEAEFLHPTLGPEDARKYEAFIKEVVKGDFSNNIRVLAYSVDKLVQLQAAESAKLSSAFVLLVEQQKVKLAEIDSLKGQLEKQLQASDDGEALKRYTG